jgi:predicted outer membrane repeat protein
MATELGNGAVFQIETLNYVNIKSTSVTFDTSASGTDTASTQGNGGVFSVKEGLTKAVDVTFTSVIFTSNSAKAGNGGVLYIP